MNHLTNIFIAIIFYSACYSQAAVSSYELAEISEERLARIDTYIESNIDKGIIPGGTFFIARKGHIILDKAYGIRNIETDEPYARNDIFRIASMTKALTSVAILQLYERGLLRLDDEVSKYLPSFEDMTVLHEIDKAKNQYEVRPAENKITIRHLLTHTSGLYYGQFVDDKYVESYQKHGIHNFGIYDPNTTTLEMANMIAKAPLMHEPGERFTYGLNMDVLGAIVEVITKKKLSLVFLTEIFYPLGMHDSHFYLPEAKYNKLVPLYTYDDLGKLTLSKDSLSDFPIFQNKGHYAGGGGASSSAKDYGKFLMALVNGGKYNGERILSRKTIELMTADQLRFMEITKEGSKFAFGLGSGLTNKAASADGPFSEGTYTWGGYFNSKWWVDPKEELVFVGMTNVLPFPHGEFWDNLYSIIYSALE